MSQIGARGLALEGKSAQEIIQHFYSGVTLDPLPDTSSLRVNVGHLLTSYSLKFDLLPSETSTGSVQIFSGDLSSLVDPTRVETPTALLDSASRITAFPSESGTILSLMNPNAPTITLSPQKIFTLRWSGTRYLEGVAILASTPTNKYRYGQIHITTLSTKDGPRLEVTNDVRLHDEYLRGIGEMPSSWPKEALSAQAIAIRSYALTKQGIFRKECDCEIYSTSKDLSFVGYSKEIEAGWGSKWVDAVLATSVDDRTGLVVTVGGRPVATYFFMSSGGHTQDVIDVWGNNLTWLQSVPDPWSLDLSINPTYATWSRTKTQAELAKVFSLDDVASYSIRSRTRGGGVKSVTATSSQGKQATLSGEVFRSRLDLPSTWLQRPLVSIGVTDEVALAISAAKISVPFAKVAVISTADTETAELISAAPLAYSLKAPLFITSSTSVDSRVIKELLRRKINKIYLVGSTTQFPSTFGGEFKRAKITVTRLSGVNRYEVATAIATIMKTAPILVSNSDADAIFDFSGVIATAGRPILWSSPVRLSRATAQFLSRSKVGLSLLGVSDHLSDEVISSLPAEYEDLRSQDGQDVAAALEVPPAIRVGVVSERHLGSIAFFEPIISSDQLSNYLTDHPDTLAVYAFGLKPDQISTLRSIR